MKLPSFQFLLQEATATFRRFPFAIVNAFIGTVAAIWLIDQPYDRYGDYPVIMKLMWTAGLGISLFTVAVLVAERRKWNASQTTIVQCGSVFLLAAYFVSLPADLEHAPLEHIVRYFVLAAGLHFLVAFAPFTRKGEINGFWEFNKVMFLRFLTAALYSGVLYVGLVVALVSLDKLLGLTIDGKRYGQLWVLLAGVFNTWFFLSGVPKDLERLEHQLEYPRGLKIFTQYVLIPLVMTYLVILYLYSGKILLEWQWPNGWVANLVLGFSIAGILSLLLVHPVREQVENVWIRFFSRWYYVALIPLVVLLTLSIWRRVSEYGITENRYFVIILGVWLAGIIVYMLLTKARNIKIIPMSLCVVAFLSAYGPWSAFNISIKSQRGRLESVLGRHSMLVDGKAQRAGAPVPFVDMKEISSIVRYLVQTHGVEILQPYFDEDIETQVKTRIEAQGGTFTRVEPSEVVALMGLKYINEWEDRESATLTFNAGREGAMQISGFEHLMHVQLNRYGGDGGKSVSVDGASYKVLLTTDSSLVVVVRDGDSVRVDLKPMIETLRVENAMQQYNYNIPQDRMQAEGVSDRLRVLLAIRQITAEQRDSTFATTTLDAYVLVGHR
jgi:hypothetical protein